MNDVTGLEPIIAVAVVGIPIALVAVLGLGWAESWRDRRRHRQIARALERRKARARIN